MLTYQTIRPTVNSLCRTADYGLGLPMDTDYRKHITSILVFYTDFTGFRFHTQSLRSRVVTDFGSGKSGIRPFFFGNLAESASGQMSSRIWRMPWLPVQLSSVVHFKPVTNLFIQSPTMTKLCHSTFRPMVDILSTVMRTGWSRLIWHRPNFVKAAENWIKKL